MGDQDKSVKVEKEPKRRLSFANRLRLYGSLVGTVGLVALVAAGCGGKSSKDNGGTPPLGNGDTPSATQGGAGNTGEQGEESDNSDLPGDTMVDVELYSADGSGETYIDRMSVEDMQALCEEQRQEMIKDAEAAGSEIIGGPIVMLPYTVVGTGQQGEYSCGQP